MMYQDIGHGLKVLELVVGSSITGRKRPIPEYLEATETAQAASMAAQERTQHEERETSR